MNQPLTLVSEPKVGSWKNSLLQSGCTLDEVKPLWSYQKRNGELLFGMFDVKGNTPEGTPLMPCVFIRGHASVIVPYVRNRRTGEGRFVTILQRRVGNGHHSLEFAAGMLDRHIASPLAVAVRELFEETGIAVVPEELFALHDKPLYSSPGVSDEAIYYYGCMIDFDNEDFTDLEGRAQGEADENEHIIVTLSTAGQIRSQATSLQVHLALHLFETYCTLHQLEYPDAVS